MVLLKLIIYFLLFRYFAIYFSLPGFTTCALILITVVLGWVFDATTMLLDWYPRRPLLLKATLTVPDSPGRIGVLG